MPGGFIYMIHRRMPDLGGNHLIGRLNGLRYPVDDLLDCAEADLQTQYGIAEGLDSGTAVRLRPRHLGNEGAQPWAIVRPMLLGNQTLVRLSATGTDPLVENKVCHVHLDLRQLDHLMGIVVSK